MSLQTIFRTHPGYTLALTLQWCFSCTNTERGNVGNAAGPLLFLHIFSKVRCQDGVKFRAAEKLRPISDPLQCGYGKYLNWFHIGGLCVCVCAPLGNILSITIPVHAVAKKKSVKMLTKKVHNTQNFHFIEYK